MWEEAALIRAAIRPARADEAAALSDLAMRAKAHWGYDEAFLLAYRQALTITPDDIAANTIAVLTRENQLCGFSQVRGSEDIAQLTDLWVDPGAIGQGFGRALWEHAIATARALGARELRVHCDPHAEGFYRAMGAERIGTQSSTVILGLQLPLLRLILR